MGSAAWSERGALSLFFGWACAARRRPLRAHCRARPRPIGGQGCRRCIAVSVGRGGVRGSSGLRACGRQSRWSKASGGLCLARPLPLPPPNKKTHQSTRQVLRLSPGHDQRAGGRADARARAGAGQRRRRKSDGDGGEKDTRARFGRTAAQRNTIEYEAACVVAEGGLV